MQAEAVLWQQRAALLLRLHRPADAARLAQQQLAADPEDAQAHLLLSQALLEQNRLPEAEQAARAALALCPQLPEAHYLLALVLQYQRRYWHAEDALARALRLDPLNPDIHGRRSANLYLQRRPIEALDAAAEGLSLDPEHLDCLMWRALAAEVTLRPDLTDRTFTTLLRLAPDDATVQANRGIVLWHRREVEAATRHLREALRLDPTLPEARRLLRTIEQAFPPKVDQPAPAPFVNPLPWWGWLAWLLAVVLMGTPAIDQAATSAPRLYLHGLGLLLSAGLVVRGSGRRLQEHWLPQAGWWLAVLTLAGLAVYQSRLGHAPLAATLLRLGGLATVLRLVYVFHRLHQRGPAGSESAAAR